MFYKFFCLRFCVSSDSEKTECNKDFTRNRSNRPKVICKKGVLRNFAKFTEKYLCQSLFFNKIAGLKPATILKKRIWHRCFLVKLAKFLRAPFLTEHLQ